MTDSTDLMLVGAHSALRERVQRLAEEAGYGTRVCEHSEEAFAHFEREPTPVVVLCATLEDDALLVAHRRLRELHAATQVIVIMPSASVVFGLRAARESVFWVLDEAFASEELLLLIARALVVHNLTQENRDLKSALSRNASRDRDLVAQSEVMSKVMKRMHRIAELDATVLLSGESGTGKTHFAALIHEASNRRDAPFMSLSCANLPRDLIEAELFGYEKGAFTGATTTRAGCFELCDGGTLFLDEIGELPIELQPKLLTVLQDKSVRRLGGRIAKRVDVRIICATNRDLEKAVAEGSFREDLFYRINVLTLELPALRNRREDIAQLVQRRLADSERRGTGGKKEISAEALSELILYEWPGNIRELGHVLERALAFSEGPVLGLEDIRRELPHAKSAQKGTTTQSFAGKTLRELESRAIQETLSVCDGDKARAAKMLGVSLKTIYNHLRRA